MEDSKLKEDAPFLFSLKKRNVYSVPDGFFQKLENDIKRNYLRKPGSLRRMKRWLEVSVAATLLSLMLFSAAKMISDKNYQPVNTDRTMYTINDGDADSEPIFPADSRGQQ